MKPFKVVIAVTAVGGAAGLAFLYSGLYPMGADVPHNRLTYSALETLRERSIAHSIRPIEVPPLDDADLILAGGADYNEMCTGCHLKPGVKDSEMTLGLYPQPPNLANPERAKTMGDPKLAAAREFWIIKHGIKASGMAAFGKTHDDARIWAMVAFIQKLRTLTPEQYQILTSRSEDESGHGGHDAADRPSGTTSEPGAAGPDTEKERVQ